MQRIAILGAGRGGLSLFRALKDNSRVNIVGICDIDPSAPGLAEAENFGVETFSDWRNLVSRRDGIDVIINVTNDPVLDRDLESSKDFQAEIIHGKAARFIWALSRAQQQLQDDAERRIVELNEMYELGLMLSSSVDLKEVYSIIINYATKLTETPAGSIAILDEKTGEMTLAAAKGFSKSFFKLDRWKLRKGGLTSYILNQEEPVILPDISSLTEGVNPALIKEGVKSLIATPLLVRGKIIGILYVDDFERREFTDRDSTILGLLSGYAALAIEKGKLLDDTRQMAITDGLTGLNNQQEFLKRLEEETARAGRYRRPLSVVELDIDYFKAYNDTHGHLAGNDILRNLAKCIGDHSRVTDLCARTGGEEFAIIMPETDFEKAVSLAERLRVMVESHECQIEERVSRITISIGVASFPEHGSTAMELYHAVDQALYKAKELGRNRVIGFPDQPAKGLVLDAD